MSEPQPLEVDALQPKLEGRRLIVGLSGGIACYKVAHLVSRFVQAGAEVTVAMTPAAARFITPLTFQSLTGRPVYASPWDIVDAHDPQHIRLARSAEAVLVAPCTMDLMARLTHGRADDAVTLIISALTLSRQPVLLAPSMNESMWNQPSTQRNLRQLGEDGFHIIQPGAGWQACRTRGVGRLAELEEIAGAVVAALKPGRTSDRV